MKQFDPQSGWSKKPKASSPPPSVPELSEPIGGAGGGKAADIYHFNRHGKRLSINAKDDEAEDLSLDQTAETTELILQLFDRLEQVDKTKEVLVRLSASLQSLEALKFKEKELLERLHVTRDEMASLLEQIQSDMLSAQTVEDTNLKIRQYRKALLSKLADQLAPLSQRAG